MPSTSAKTTALALAAMVLIGALAGARLWASHALGELSQVFLVRAAPDGRVHVLFDDTLWIEGPGGRSHAVIPLDRLGIDSFIGDFLPLPGGHILLPRGTLPEADMAEKLRIFLRQPPAPDRAPGARAEPLKRCSLDTYQCHELDGPDSDRYFRTGRTFRLETSPRDGHVLIADTARHRLLEIDPRGRIVQEAAGVFRFPNQIAALPDGELLVADSNHWRLATVSLAPDRFGEVLRQISVMPWERARGNRYPSGLARDSAGNLWTVVNSQWMDRGQLFRVPAGGTGAARVDLPAGADPLFVAALGDTVLIPDLALYRIHRFHADGTRLDDFGSPALVQRMAAVAHRAARWRAVFDASLPALVIVAVPLIVIGLSLRSRQRAGATAAPAGPAPAGAPTRQVLVMPHPADRAGAPAAERGVFVRGNLVLSGRERVKAGVVVSALMAALFIVLRLLLWVDDGALGPWLPRAIGALLLSASITSLVHYAICRARERLIVDHTGVHYRSPLRGPLRFLHRLHPDWSVAWPELAQVSLRYRSTGAHPLHWYYELKTAGETRKLRAFAWVSRGGESGVLRLADLRRREPEVLQQGLRRSRLYACVTAWLAGRERRDPDPGDAPA